MQICEIKYALHYDHALVSMDIQIQAQRPRGPGFRKFNSSLLEEKEFTDDLTQKIHCLSKNTKMLKTNDFCGNDKNRNKNFYDIIFKTKSQKYKKFRRKSIKRSTSTSKSSREELGTRRYKKYDNVHSRPQSHSVSRTITSGSGCSQKFEFFHWLMKLNAH